MKFQAAFLSSQSCHAFFHSVGCHMLVSSLDLILTKFLLTLLEVSPVSFPTQVCILFNPLIIPSFFILQRMKMIILLVFPTSSTVLVFQVRVH